jgi:hypothetical protein
LRRVSAAGAQQQAYYQQYPHAMRVDYYHR